MRPAGGFQLRPYRDGDEGAIAPGFSRVFPSPRSMAQWRWIYQEAPDGAYVMLCWAPNGELAAQYAATAHRAVCNGETIEVGQIRDAFSMPRYRTMGRHGAFVRTARAFYQTWGEKLDFFYGFPSARHFRLGRQLVDYRRFTSWSRARVVIRGSYSNVDRPTPTGVVREVSTFDTGFDDLWSARKERVRLAVVRDARFLSWRFSKESNRVYWVWAFFPYLSSKMLGYVIFLPQKERALLIDFCFPSEARFYRPFWRQVSDKLYWRGVREVETWFAPSAPDLPALVELGFEVGSPGGDIVPSFIVFRPRLAPAWIEESFYYNMADSDLY